MPTKVRKRWPKRIAGALILVGCALALPPSAGRSAQAQPSAPAMPRTQSPCPEIADTLAAVLAESADGALSAEHFERLVQAARTCYTVTLWPQMEAVREDCTAFQAFLEVVLQWQQAVRLLELQDRLAPQVAAAAEWMIAGWVNCYNAAYTRCVEQYDAAAGLTMQEAAKQLGLLGAEDRIDHTKVEKCLTFEIFFESRLEVSHPNFQISRSHVRATVPLHRDDAIVLTGEGLLDYVSYSLQSWPVCPLRVVSFMATSPVVVKQVSFDLEKLLARQGDVMLAIIPGQADELHEFTCSAPGQPRNLRVLSWMHFYFVRMELGEITDPLGMLTVTGWTPIGGRVLAQKTIKRTVTVARSSGASVMEDTVFELRHAPVR